MLGFLKILHLFLFLLIWCLLNASTQVEEQKCHDKFGQVDVKKFPVRGCVTCFSFLFNYPGITAVFNFSSIDFLNPHLRLISNSSKSIHRPRADNISTIDKVCAFGMEKDHCDRWKTCCRDAIKCCKLQRKAKKTGESCHATWDGYKCWDQQKAGHHTYQQCPDFVPNMVTTKRAEKTCLANATWLKKDKRPWTDYTSCLTKAETIISGYISLGASIASIVCLVPAIIIFCIYKDLRRQDRVRLHIHFFVSLIAYSTTNILWTTLVHLDMLLNERYSETAFQRNPVWCRLLSYFKIYFMACIYLWMFCEGYYLHRLITQAFEPPKTLLPLYFIGWGLPVFAVTAYAIIRAVLANESCWAQSYGNYQWIYYVPNLLCLTINLIFLSNILRILLFQLHSHPHEPSNFRRGLKAAFMLVPLFGLQFFLTIYNPPRGAAGKEMYEGMHVFVTNSQGIFVSLIFCFFNSEVMTHLRISCPCCKTPRRDSAYQNTQISHFDSRPSINGTGNGNGGGSNPSIEMYEVKNYEFKNDQSKRQMGILKY